MVKLFIITDIYFNTVDKNYCHYLKSIADIIAKDTNTAVLTIAHHGQQFLHHFYKYSVRYIAILSTDKL